MDHWTPRLQDSGSGAGHPERGRERSGLINQKRVQKTVDRYNFLKTQGKKFEFTKATIRKRVLKYPNRLKCHLKYLGKNMYSKHIALNLVMNECSKVATISLTKTGIL
jgi:hypothetical protein